MDADWMAMDNVLVSTPTTTGAKTAGAGSGDGTPMKKRGARRDREFRRYAEAVVDLQASLEGNVAMSSMDGSLTAFTQLVALRLNAKRAIISLFDREKQYVIAEATRTLSLQKDAVHAPCDGLWFGASVWDRIPDDFFRQTLKARKTIAEDGTSGKRYFEANDLCNDARYASHRFVVNEPFARSFAGVPLLTPNGYAIGTVSFFDDKPRERLLTDEEVTFMQDIASTIMAHVEKTRLVVNHTRSVRMFHGLSRFIEGKATADGQLDSSFRDAEHMQDHQNSQTSQLGASRRTHAMNAASNAERVDDYRRAQPLPGRSRPILRAVSGSSIEESYRIHPKAVQPPEGEPEPLLEESSDPPLRLRATLETTRGTPVQRETLPEDLSLQEDLLSKDVKHSFERAAAIINTAMNLSGTLFLDASVGEYGRLRGGDGNGSSAESDLDRSEPDSVKSEGDVPSPWSGSRREDSSSGIGMLHNGKRQSHGMRAGARRGTGEDDKPKSCPTLASAYNMPLTASGKAEIIHSPIPERYLKSLLRRFPYGKQWNFDLNGNTSSDEFSDSSVATDTTGRDDGEHVSGSRRSRTRRPTDGQILLSLFPGARSLALMPMYDGARERFFAGAFIWSYDPIRVLTVQDDLNYLGAFCDVIMAEVGRLDAQREALTKQTFISSMSHELRTPLHGILGGIECLQGKNDHSAMDQDMLQMIESSGRSLLDIVDSLLEHAHATNYRDRKGSLKNTNKVTRNREGSVPSTLRHNTDSSVQHPCDLALLTEEVLDTALWTMPKPSTHLEEKRQDAALTGEAVSEPIKVILEVDASATGEFRVNAGAWRRIVQNLASNAMKYTSGGYLKMSLSTEPSQRDQDIANNGTTMVELVCLDSGRGMTQQFLKFGLWQAFSQEDSSSQGTGLGLSLVLGMVKEMGGTIDVQSSKGVGTAIRVRIPLRKHPRRSSASPYDMGSVSLERLKSCNCAILGFDGDDNTNERSMKATALLKKSIADGCTNYGVHVVKRSHRSDKAEGQSSPQADIVIMSEKSAIQTNQPGSKNDLEKCVFQRPTIILCHSIASSRLMPDLENAIAVAQPLGPRKLLRALTTCLEKIRPDSTQIVDTHGNKSEGNDQSPLVLTSRPEFTPRSSYFGTLSLQSNTSQLTSISGLATLLVDDNDINLMLLRAYMNKNKHAFTCASNGLEAVNAYKDCFSRPGLILPTVILMDLTMPVMSGLEATRQIRTFERSRSIRPPSMIIALTAMSSSEARQEDFGSGVDHFMTKPVKLSALGKIVGKHVEERNAADRCRE